MIPIRLTIEGLYSYKQRQTIDFSKLTENHLFGIFGEVGSGKSSILDAMLFAIYGKTDRLGNSSGFLYNMMNLQSDRLFLEFDCWSGPQNSKQYRFLYEARRNSKRFEDVKKYRKVISIREQGQWTASEHLRAEEIIGMSADNFRRTIIIPQGKFREFLELTGGQRTAMMQELFPLERFDLFDRTKRLKAKSHDALLQVNTRLEALQEYTPEKLGLQKEELRTQEHALQQLEEQLAKAQLALQAMQQTQQLFEEKAAAERDLQGLHAKNEEFAQRKQQLAHYREAILHFKEKITQFKDLSREVDQLDTTLHRLASEKNLLQRQLEQAKQVLTEKEQVYAEREKIKQQCEDLEKVMQLKDEEAKLSSLELQLSGSQELLAQAIAEETKRKESIVEAEVSLKKLREEASKITDLSDLLHWKSREQDLNQQLSKAELRLKNVKEKSADLLSTWKEKLEKEGGTAFYDEKLAICKNHLQKEKQRVTAEKKVLHEKWQQINHQHALSQHVALLEDGKPCPLCGSLHHPNPANSSSTDQELVQIESAQVANEQQTERLETWINSLTGLAQQTQTYEEQATEWQETINSCQQEITDHQASWQWKGQEGTSIETLKIQKARGEQVRKSINELEKTVTTNKQALEKEQLTVKTLEEESHAKKLVISGLQAKVAQIKESLHHPGFANLTEKPHADLEKSLQRGREKIDQAEQDYKIAQEQSTALEKAVSEKAGILTIQQENLSRLRAKQVDLEQALNDKIKGSSFNGLHEVKNLLQMDFDADAEEKVLDAFQKSVTENEARLREINIKIGDKAFDVQLFERQKEQTTQLSKEKESLLQKIALSEQYIGETEKNLHLRKQLEAELATLEQRDENLKVLMSLFKAKGFVNYISAVYLENLVKAADKRFMQLTRNNLSLRLNSDYEFIVSDQLNGGKERLLKTLSGGQTFQAALCLALALAENIKSLNQSEKSFFFLDEGFGTLDKKSLAVVFETLRALQKEDRIVGIISHVDELQQEIPVSLHIQLDAEEGSKVRYSWEG